MNINKYELKDAIEALLVRFLVWVAAYSLITGLLKSGIQKEPVFGLVHYVLWYAVLYFSVIRRGIRFFKPDFKASRLLTEIRDKRVRKEKKEAEEARRVAMDTLSKTSDEVAAFREKVRNDIVTCICDTGLKWGWMGPNTWSRLFFFKEGAPGTVFEGTVHYSDDHEHVEFITIVMNGEEISCRNWPYLVKAGATAVAASEPTEPEHPTTSTEEVGSPSSTTKQDSENGEASDSTVSPPTVYAEPDIPQDVLATSVNLIGDAYAERVSSLASCAVTNGDPAITIEWPEGIHSFKEATMLKTRFVESMGFSSGTVDGDNLTIILTLPSPSEETEEAKAAVANVEVEQEYDSSSPASPVSSDTSGTKETEETSSPPLNLNDEEDAYEDEDE